MVLNIIFEYNIIKENIRKVIVLFNLFWDELMNIYNIFNIYFI